MKQQSFIIKTNFHFVEDFCKDREFNGKKIDFYDLSPIDRVLLSVYLTGLISKKFTHSSCTKKKVEQMINIIFNFNGRKKRFRTDLKMFKDAKKLIEAFLNENNDYCEYVSQQKIKKVTNIKDLFKMSLNPTEFGIVDKMGFKKLENILYTIYILGTAKNKTSCAHLNKIDLHKFSDSLKSSKVLMDKLFGLMEWEYIQIDKHYIGWKSRWKMELNSSDLTYEEEIERKLAELIKDE